MGPPKLGRLAGRCRRGKLARHFLSISVDCGSNKNVSVAEFIRQKIKVGRKRNAVWVRIFDVARLMPSAEGRSRLWTLALHRSQIHQTSPQTAEERYPELFELAKHQLPAAMRILSFGCSTGEELISLRRRFPRATITGAEINSRSRRIAKQRLRRDNAIEVVPPAAIDGDFDVIFALAVFQRDPHKIIEMEVANLAPFYPFVRFDRTLCDLVNRLRPGGLLCVANAQYRVEDSSAADRLQPVDNCPRSLVRSFAASGQRFVGAPAATMFVKV